jgi:hypothetical protein
MMMVVAPPLPPPGPASAEAAEGAGHRVGLQFAGGDDGAVVPPVEEAEQAVVQHGQVGGEEREAAPDVEGRRGG